MTLSDRSLAWLVVATPRPERNQKELDQLRRRAFELGKASDRSERDRLETEHARARFRELSLAGPTGTWETAVFVGSRSSDSTQASRAPADRLDADRLSAIASLLCSAAEHSITGYRLRPIRGGLPKRLPELLVNTETAFIATTELLAQLVRSPELEIPGIRVLAPPRFDVTPGFFEHDVTDAIHCGQVLDANLRPSTPITVKFETLNSHTFVCGATGSGKSQTVRSLLQELARSEIPWLVIEPAKAEYRRMAGRLRDLPNDDVLIIRPGDRETPPGSLNPFEPASLQPGDPVWTFPLQSHADLIRALFLAAFDIQDPFPQIMGQAINESYEWGGWDLVTGRPHMTWDDETGQPRSAPGTAVPRYPSLGDLQRVALKVAANLGYDEEGLGRIKGFLNSRIGSLRSGTPGRFFEGGHPLDVGALLKRNVVIEAETITDDRDKAFFMGVLLIRIYEQLFLENQQWRLAETEKAKNNPQYKVEPTPLRHVFVIEEAHRLLRRVDPGSPAGHALEMFASLLAEVRAYGQGIVIVEQIPSKVVRDVIKNTAFKVMHRLPADDDRRAVGATMNLSAEQSEYVVSLGVGRAAVFTDGMDRPLLAVMPDRVDSEIEQAQSTILPPLFQNRRRSRACGVECRDGSPCSTETIREAELVLNRLPELTFFMEMSCAAHILGYSGPKLNRTHGTSELRQLDSWWCSAPLLMQLSMR